MAGRKAPGLRAVKKRLPPRFALPTGGKEGAFLCFARLAMGYKGPNSLGYGVFSVPLSLEKGHACITWRLPRPIFTNTHIII